MLTETGNSIKHEILIRRRSKKLSKIFRPSTSYPRPSTIYPRRFTLDPRPVTLDPRPSTKRQTQPEYHQAFSFSRGRRRKQDVRVHFKLIVEQRINSEV